MKFGRLEAKTLSPRLEFLVGFVEWINFSLLMPFTGIDLGIRITDGLMVIIGPKKYKDAITFGMRYSKDILLIQGYQ